jgi:cytidine deaminase
MPQRLRSRVVLTDAEMALVRRAQAVIAGVEPDGNHTVAAAAYDSAGHIYTGVNVYHFSGGPCAEPVAIGQAVAAPEAELPLTTMVAVIADGGGVIPPCGRCRQMLYDYYPDIRVVLHVESGLAAVPIVELLPYAFDRRKVGQQVLYLDERYLDAVRQGTKRTTVRRHDPVRTGPVRFVFPHPDKTSTTMDATVTEIETKPMAALDDGDAVRDGFADRTELLAALKRHYPGLDAAAEVDIVHFRLDA